MNSLGSWWSSKIEKMMMPGFEKIANTYQNQLKLNRIEQLCLLAISPILVSILWSHIYDDSRRNVARASNREWYQERGYKNLDGHVEPDKFNAERERLGEAIVTRD